MRGFSLCRLPLCTGHAELSAAHAGCCFARGAPSHLPVRLVASGPCSFGSAGAAPCHGAAGAGSHGAQRSSAGCNVGDRTPAGLPCLSSEVIWALAALGQDLSSPVLVLNPCWEPVVILRFRPETPPYSLLVRAKPALPLHRGCIASGFLKFLSQQGFVMMRKHGAALRGMGFSREATAGGISVVRGWQVAQCISEQDSEAFAAAARAAEDRAAELSPQGALWLSV